MTPCPAGYFPGCSCSSYALEPSEDCYVHGAPDVRRCPNCGQFRGRKACKRCGCAYGVAGRPPEATEGAPCPATPPKP